MPLKHQDIRIPHINGVGYRRILASVFIIFILIPVPGLADLLEMLSENLILSNQL